MSPAQPYVPASIILAALPGCQEISAPTRLINTVPRPGGADPCDPDDQQNLHLQQVAQTKSFFNPWPAGGALRVASMGISSAFICEKSDRPAQRAARDSSRIF